MDSVTKNAGQIGTQAFRIELIDMKWIRFYCAFVQIVQIFEVFFCCSTGHAWGLKNIQIGYLQHWPIRDENVGIPLLRFSTLGVPHMEVLMLLYTCVWHYSNTVHEQEPWRFILHSWGTLHMYKAHLGLVLNLRCALMQLNFFSIFTSFEKTFKTLPFEQRHTEIPNHRAY